MKMAMPMGRSAMAAVLLVLLAVSCKKHRLDNIDVSGLDVNVKVQRFDRDLFAINPDSVEAGLPALRERHGQFANLFFEGIIRIGKPENPQHHALLRTFLTDTMVRNSYRRVQATFDNLNKLNSTLTDAFRRYCYHFPARKVPTVIAFVSGYNLSVAIDENLVAIGLDRYLGQNTPQYRLLGIPRYMAGKMTPEKIPSDAVRAWLYGEFAYNDSVDNLLSNMLYEGTLTYITRHLLPNEPEHLIHGFSEEQLRWCRRSERDMWTHLIENKLLFTTSTTEINKFVNEAPFTSGFPQESPGRAAVWIGYRIVESLMQRHEQMSLEELMEMRSYQKMLNISRYKP